MSHRSLHASAPQKRLTDAQLEERRFERVGRLAQQEPPAPPKRRRAVPWCAVIVLSAIVLGCLLADVICPGDPNYMDLLSCRKAPCAQFSFGTDSVGRDIFSMIWHGGRVSLLIGALATVISTLIAVVYGSISGMAPDWLDALMMRLLEILLSVPSLLAVVFIQAMLGEASVVSIALVLGMTEWMSVAKVVRTQVRTLRSSEYVIASKCMGGGFWHVLWNHLAPNFVSSIMFMVAMNLRSAIVAESTLSFMGVGLPLDVVSWGSMLSGADKALLSGAWWIILIPGAFLIVTLMCVTDVGNALRREVNRRESIL